MNKELVKKWMQTNQKFMVVPQMLENEILHGGSNDVENAFFLPIQNSQLVVIFHNYSVIFFSSRFYCNTLLPQW